MAEELRNGYQIRTIDGVTVTVKKKLGGGGQGDVYLVNYNGEEKALKWYKKAALKTPDAFYNNLKNNKNHGIRSDAFLWPLDVTEWQDGTFGYIMNLKPEGFYEASDFMVKNVTFSSYKAVIDAALNIVNAYRLLHNAGYSYQDLNDGNFFINPKTGKVLICDNDNVAPDKTETGIAGKPRYMAPEIVIGKTMPNSLSDRFSMSIILFILFCMTHPLEGKKSLEPCMTPELQKKLYGTEATFIMDPNDKSNKPDPVVHPNVKKVWPCLPEYMQKIFIDAFSKKAIENPNARPTEKDWIQNLVRFRSEVVRCKCGTDVFTKDGMPTKCDGCNKMLNFPYRLKLSEYTIPGVHDSRIYKCQIGICRADEALDPIGRVMAKKDDPTMLGIRNLSNKIWKATTPSGKAKNVDKDEVVPLKDGITFEVGDETISIISNK